MIKGNLTLKDVLEYSDQDLRNMSKEDLVKLARQASGIAKSRRKTALRQLERNPDLPVPTAYKEWGTKSDKSDNRWLKEDGRAPQKSWLNFNFDYYKKIEDRGRLENYVQDVIRFLDTKTSNISNWKQTIKSFENRISKSLQTGVKVTGETYKEFWRIAQAISERDVKYRYGNYGKQIAQELQDMVWKTMLEMPFDDNYNENITIEKDKYAQRVISAIMDRLDTQYEEYIKSEREQEEKAIGRQKERSKLKKL